MNVASPTAAQIALLQHTLGLAEWQRTSNRNFFNADEGHGDMPDLRALEAAGYMTSKPAPEWAGGGTIFFATDSGLAVALAALPPERKRTAMEEWRDSDSDTTFAEWIGAAQPRREYESAVTPAARYGHRVRLVLGAIETGYHVTLKAAKAEFKALRKAARQPVVA
ncbi:hypothetical protein BJP27_24520 (plasmid) [Pseudomonas oryzihabitans]|nr:hypothetical protein BJP27_23870 [Pseudomonas psychrotolerans]APQ14737.1 hypothetical protein BJP27_24520 [Pseudomonas psychrotolerans]